MVMHTLGEFMYVSKLMGCGKEVDNRKRGFSCGAYESLIDSHFRRCRYIQNKEVGKGACSKFSLCFFCTVL